MLSHIARQGARARVPFASLAVARGTTLARPISILTSQSKTYSKPLLSSLTPSRRWITTQAGNTTSNGSNQVPPRSSSWLSFLMRHRFLRWGFLGIFSMVFGSASIIGIILAHDALTYRHVHIDDIPTSPLALHPKPGGPKNLPIVSDFVEEDQDEACRQQKTKQRLVIVGGGWAAVSLLSKLDKDKYNVTLVAPNNFYLFTPLLPSATVGTVEPRSLIEPLRKVLTPHRGHFIQGNAVDVHLGTQDGQRLLEIQLVSGQDPLHSHPEAVSKDKQNEEKHDIVQDRHVYLPYDKLVVAVGSVTSSHGVPGLEHAFHLKSIDDARAIRSRILDNLELAALPTTTPEERERLLSFVISGGGPTGVETASEIYDMLNEDVLDYYPKLLRQQAKVHLIQSRSHILNTYSEKISEYAERKFDRDAVDVVVNARVKEVKPDSVIYTIKHEDGSVTEKEVPSGMTLWSTGIAMSPFTKRMTEVLPNQSHLKALLVDSQLRVKGTPQGTVYALGDASTIDSRLIDYLYEFVDKYDTNQDGKLSFEEFSHLANEVGKKFPLASKHFTKIQDIFNDYDTDHDGSLCLNEIAKMFLETGKKMTALPATAQVAAQQGTYLAKKLNKLSDKSAMTDDEEVYRPFNYTNLGSLAYIGNAAAFDIPFLPESIQSFAGGLIAMYMWRSFYLSEQVSTRTRMLLLNDYIRRGIWGRDISRI
ncbi:unnamed protein product [Sympodiomycopsis kandeliae]